MLPTKSRFSLLPWGFGAPETPIGPRLQNRKTLIIIITKIAKFRQCTNLCVMPWPPNLPDMLEQYKYGRNSSAGLVKFNEMLWPAVFWYALHNRRGIGKCNHYRKSRRNLCVECSSERKVPWISVFSYLNQQVSHIITHYCRGTTRVAEALKSNSALKTLCIQGCQINDKGATSLADMLLHNQTLSNIDYSDNLIGTEGLHALHLSWTTSRSIEKRRMVVTGGRFSIRTATPDFSEDLHKNSIAPSAATKAAPAKSQFEWAKEQLLATQAKNRVRRRWLPQYNSCLSC